MCRKEKFPLSLLEMGSSFEKQKSILIQANVLERQKYNDSTLLSPLALNHLMSLKALSREDTVPNVRGKFAFQDETFYFTNMEMAVEAGNSKMLQAKS